MQPLDHYDATPLDFDSKRALQPGETLELQAVAVELLIPRLIRVPHELCLNFELVDVFVNGRSQYNEPGPIPCEIFSDASVGPELGLDTCEPGEAVVLKVRNTTSCPMAFRARIYAEAIDSVYWDERKGVR
jgi:hypothetical protein